jgi:hypothetical protein
LAGGEELARLEGEGERGWEEEEEKWEKHSVNLAGKKDEEE